MEALRKLQDPIACWSEFLCAKGESSGSGGDVALVAVLTEDDDLQDAGAAEVSTTSAALEAVKQKPNRATGNLLEFLLDLMNTLTHCRSW